MGYYGMRGDYYRGDYYRGDFFGSLGSAITGAVKGFATGGIGGALSGAVAGFSGGGSKKSSPSPIFPQGGGVQIPGLGPLGGIGTKKSSYGPDAGPGTPGYHISKHSGKLVRNRHMNVTNPRALRRAIRRARGFEKMALKVIGFSHPHKKRGRPYFKKARAR